MRRPRIPAARKRTVRPRAAGVGLFIAYAMGMGLVVGTAAVSLAVARTALLGRVRRLAPAIARAGGAVMVVAGGHVAYYGWYEVRVLDGDDPTDPVIDAAAQVQLRLAGGVDRLGVAAVAVGFLAVAAIAAVAARQSERGQRESGGQHHAMPGQHAGHDGGHGDG